MLRSVINFRNKIFGLIALLVAFGLTACSSSDGTGTMRVSLTDAPADYAEVNIEIHQVLVKENDDDDDDLDETEDMDEEELEDAGWKVVFNDTITVNLLDYQNGATLDLGEVELETGRYNQVRLVLGDENNVVLNNGNTFQLDTPSGQTSGYKLLVQADIEEDQVYDLVIDFDASRSIVVTGNGSYKLKPVLKTANLTASGSISGTILPLEANPYVYAIAGTDTSGTQADENGDFRIIGLDNGTYKIEIKSTNDAYRDSTITDIEVEDGEDVELEEDITLEANS
ncbi:MAG: DUF4382 domain-containing protein [Balneola sp.]|nr:DUF4382 domain-containing protein [Balneola sp.]MBO6651745.1 DUF4382 domain-containing protein [Balneola sp.]MBO6711093.1 DUF4382 domain-containing protein [Balneola sp.]MBO6800793.1 DUF4382 domain-containing protein [Balneola sp.]MBO6869028.1 DUF4382 domain-containing protein [Balneola sp.]